MLTFSFSDFTQRLRSTSRCVTISETPAEVTRGYSEKVGRIKKKRMGATYVGVRRAHSFLWSLSSPQQPLETEDSPTVSLAPQYTSQRLCRATDRKTITQRLRLSFDFSHKPLFLNDKDTRAGRPSMKFFQSRGCRNCIEPTKFQASSLRITDARSLAYCSIFVWLSPSIITRARASVPE